MSRMGGHATNPAYAPHAKRSGIGGMGGIVAAPPPYRRIAYGLSYARRAGRHAGQTLCSPVRSFIGMTR